MNLDYLKDIESALEAVNHALQTIDAVENSGIKIHPSIGNRLNTAQMVVSETLSFAREEQEKFSQISEPSKEPAINTKITYLYRDADNYKVWNDCVISGIITPEQHATILDCLDSGEFFIPSLVGLPEVKFGREDDPEVDHQWFEMNKYAFKSTYLAPTVSISADVLVENFCKCKGIWNDLYWANYPEQNAWKPRYCVVGIDDNRSAYTVMEYDSAAAYWKYFSRMTSTFEHRIDAIKEGQRISKMSGIPFIHPDKKCLANLIDSASSRASESHVSEVTVPER